MLPDMTKTRILFLLAWVVAPLAAQQLPPVWKWDYPKIAATVNKVRAGRDLTPRPWPNGARVAVALSFDMDSETGFLRSGQVSAQPLSRGEYGPRVGVPRILKMLETHAVPVTFFIPAVSAQLHPEAIDAILKSKPGHEIGVHGWVHERISDLSAAEERDLTRRAFDFWTKRLGRKPVGIRTPDRKSTRLNSSHSRASRMPSSA